MPPPKLRRWDKMGVVPLTLRPHENVVYPMPYVETEAHPTVVTTQRVVHLGDEIATRDVKSAGRKTQRPLWVLGLFLILLALPLAGYGGYLMFTVWGMEAAPPTDLLKEEGEPPPDGEDWPIHILKVRAAGAGSLAGAALFGLAGLKLFRRKRWLVICRGGGKALRIQVATEMQQTQVLMTIQAVQGKG